MKNFDIDLSQMAKNALKLSTMVGENFEIYLSQIAKNAFKLFTMVGENFEIDLGCCEVQTLSEILMLEKI